MLDETERGRLLDAIDQPGMYVDPSLNDIGTYARFLVTLFKAKLIRFGVQAKSVCGVFCVAKKTPGRLRLVIDCRRSNRLFKDPPWTPLGTLEGLSRVWLESEKEGFIAQEDVKDYFYRIWLDPRIGQYFGLPEISVYALLSAFCEGEAPPELTALEGSSFVNATFSVMPMGFSLAFSWRRRCIGVLPLSLSRV